MGQNAVFSWTLGAEFRFFSYNENSIEIHKERKNCHGNLPACDKERYSGTSIDPSKSLEQVFP